MLITITHNGKYASLQAPLGAGAFAVYVDVKAPTIMHVVFAMIQPNDGNALGTLQRVTNKATNLEWSPVSARPESVRATYFSKDHFVEYVFVEENGVWLPKTPALANFLTAMQLAQGMSAKPPPELAANMADFAI
jgi:hypothetical protein